LHACDDRAPPDIFPRGLLEKCVNKIEYKSVLLPYKTGLFQGDAEDPLAMALNKAGEEGWSLSQIVLPSTVWGRANTMIAIMQRPKA
jgi:hypothetical protein